MLPDDLNQWPDDPHELLGVDADADCKTLKRAYARLIRQYKPEHFPEQFRRIRDAYESLIEYAKWREQWEVSFDDEDAVDRPSTDGDSIADNSPEDAAHVESGGEELSPGADGAGETWPSVEREPGEIDVAWKLARDGELGAAYRELKAIAQRDADDEESRLRLYWLLVLDRSLDPQQQRCQWLAEGAAANGLHGRAMGAYFDELMHAPAEALTPRCGRLLTGGGDTWRLLNLAQIRWREAGDARRWAMIHDDIAALRDSVLDDDPENWARMLIAALDRLVWTEDEAAVGLSRELLAELDSLDELHLRMDGDFERVDVLLDLAGDVRKIAFGDPDLPIGWVSRTWNRPYEQVRTQAEQLVARWQGRSDAVLDELDRLADWSHAIVGHLASVLDQAGYEAFYPSGQEAEQLHSRLCDLFAEHNWMAYERMRVKLLQFAGRECLTADWLEHALASSTDYELMREEEFVLRLSRDLTFGCACKVQLL